MGASYSENVATSAAEAAAKASTSVIDTCTQDVNLSQQLNVMITGNAHFYAGRIDLTEGVGVNLQCINSQNVSNMVQTAIKQSVGQVAKSINAAMMGGEADADNYVNVVTQMVDQVAVTVANSCLQRIVEQQTATFGAGDNASVFIGEIDFSENVDSMAKCASDTIINTSIGQQLQVTIQQQATAVNIGLGIVAAFIVILVIFVLLIVEEAGDGVVIIIGIILFVLFILALLFVTGLPPFNPGGGASRFAKSI